MTDYYQTLGLDQNATPEQIKKAYRSLAMKHHPDRGGDQAKFKEVSVAYDTLSDPQKKAEYDAQRSGGTQFRFHTGSGDFSQFAEMFGGAFDPFGHQSNPFFGRRVQRNRDLNIRCQISLVDAYNGKQLEAQYQLPSGKLQNVVINLPAGINHGETIRYTGLGDDSNPQAPRGHLNVTIIIMPNPDFTRDGDDLYTTVDINPIEAMIGCRKQVKNINGNTMMLDIRAGVETGTEFASTGQGFPNVQTGQRGRFVSVIRIKTPAITDTAILEKLKQINNEINNKT
jgi:curved DNA-binding protein